MTAKVALRVGLASAAFALLALFQLLPHPEDSFFFNCHINGNGNCGSGAIWHGYVNWSSDV
jgi:hypothetical protein